MENKRGGERGKQRRGECKEEEGRCDVMQPVESTQGKIETRKVTILMTGMN